jgi:hypothetical protein
MTHSDPKNPLQRNSRGSRDGRAARRRQRTYGAEIVEPFDASSEAHRRILALNPNAVKDVQLYGLAGQELEKMKKIVGVFHALKRKGDPLSVRIARARGGWKPELERDDLGGACLRRKWERHTRPA